MCKCIDNIGWGLEMDRRWTNEQRAGLRWDKPRGIKGLNTNILIIFLINQSTNCGICISIYSLHNKPIWVKQYN